MRLSWALVVTRLLGALDKSATLPETEHKRGIVYHNVVVKIMQNVMNMINFRLLTGVSVFAP